MNNQKVAILTGEDANLTHGYRHIYDLLDYAAEHFPDNGTFYIDAAGNEEKISYREQRTRALSILARLKTAGAKYGDVVVADLLQSRDYYSLMWACFYGGMIIAPLPRAAYGMLDGVRRISKALNPFFVVDESVYSSYQAALEKDVRLLCFVNLNSAELRSSEKDIVDSKPSDPVYLQFSSGTTGNGKGVLLTNSNLVHACFMLTERKHFDETDRALTWLPHTHNLGAFTFTFPSAAMGNNAWYLQPETFVRNPEIYLRKASEHKITRLCSNNLGIALLIRQLTASNSSYDLSSIRGIYVGSEKVSGELLSRLAQILRINTDVIQPGYGLSESTVVVAISDGFNPQQTLRISRKELLSTGKVADCNGYDDSDSMELTENGRPLPCMRVGIFDEKNVLMEENRVGSIRIQGPAVFCGYRVNGDYESAFADGWMITGDTGFIRDGKLYITGRTNDIVIIRGENYLLTDMEDVLKKRRVFPGEMILIASDRNSTQEELIAFVEGDNVTEETAQNMRRVIAEVFALPIRFVIPVEKIARTASGKANRFAMCAAYESGKFDKVIAQYERKPEVPPKSSEMSVTFTESVVKKCWGKVLDLDTSQIPTDATFKSLGGNSVKGFYLLNELEAAFDDLKLNHDFISKCATVADMADYISRKGTVSKSQAEEAEEPEEEIAITGMAFRLPMCDTKEKLWEILSNGRDCVRPVSQKRRRLAGEENWETVMGELYDVERFDYDFFDVSEQDARFMDPQQRLCMEVAQDAMDDSGESVSGEAPSRIAILSVASPNTYLPLIMDYVKKHGTEELPATAMIGNLNSAIASRIAHHLNTCGGAMAIDTACSSFLTAVVLARRMLLDGEVRGVLVTGSNLMLTKHTHILAEKAGILSKQGCSKVFDQNADGSLLGEGTIAIYMEGFRRAVRLRKHIYGVIVGAASNNDGSSLSIMAPNPAGQYHVIREAYERSGIDPAQISYLEAHGTGTRIGDPIELSALKKAFPSRQNQKIPIGSVKTNFGHLLCCAGGLGLVKVLLCIERSELVPSLHVERPNPMFESSGFPLRIITQHEKWEVAQNQERYAAVSSFGLGGSNAHVIVRSYTEPSDTVEEDSAEARYLLALSAKTDGALDEMWKSMQTLEWGRLHPASVCYTLGACRRHYQYRLAAVLNSAGTVIGEIRRGAKSRLSIDRAVVILGGIWKSIKDMAQDALSYYAGNGITVLTEQELPAEAGKWTCAFVIGVCQNTLTDLSGCFRRIISIEPQDTENELLYRLLQELYIAGAELNWERLTPPEHRRVVSLPSYPYQRKSVWISAAEKEEDTNDGYERIPPEDEEVSAGRSAL